MSNNIAVFETPRDGTQGNAKPVYLTAYVGPEPDRRRVQLTIGGEYALLTEAQVRLFAEYLLRRVDGDPEFSATSRTLDYWVTPHGLVGERQ